MCISTKPKIEYDTLFFLERFLWRWNAPLRLVQYDTLLLSHNDAHIPVAWEMPVEALFGVLSVHFKTDGRGYSKPLGAGVVDDSFTVYERENIGDKKRHYYSERLINYLFGNVAAIEVNLGYGKGYIPIAIPAGFIAPEYYVVKGACLNSKCRLIRSTDANPLVIKNLTRKQLKNITTIEAKVVVMTVGDIKNNKIKGLL